MEKPEDINFRAGPNNIGYDLPTCLDVRMNEPPAPFWRKRPARKSSLKPSNHEAHDYPDHDSVEKDRCYEDKKSGQAGHSKFVFGQEESLQFLFEESIHRFTTRSRHNRQIGEAQLSPRKICDTDDADLTLIALDHILDSIQHSHENPAVAE